MRMAKKIRADHEGEHRQAFEKNKKKILMSQTVCGICGQPVDKTLRFPHPLSPTIDHIIPINQGGHPSDIDNLQLAHFTCNRQKSDLPLREQRKMKKREEIIGNRVLPHSIVWELYKPTQNRGI